MVCQITLSIVSTHIALTSIRGFHLQGLCIIPTFTSDLQRGTWRLHAFRKIRPPCHEPKSNQRPARHVPVPSASRRRVRCVAIFHHISRTCIDDEISDVENPISLPPSTLSQPIPIDLNGDMKIDLLGITPSSKSNPLSPFKVWQNVWNASQPHSPLFKMFVYPIFSKLTLQLINGYYCSIDPHFSGAQCTLSNPHSNAVVDLNGDCLAGLFTRLTQEYFSS